MPLEEYLAKVRAAVAARTNPDFVIIARTDARAVLGFEAAIARANAALEVGADVAFVEAPQTVEEVLAYHVWLKAMPSKCRLAWQDTRCRLRRC